MLRVTVHGARARPLQPQDEVSKPPGSPPHEGAPPRARLRCCERGPLRLWIALLLLTLYVLGSFVSFYLVDGEDVFLVIGNTAYTRHDWLPAKFGDAVLERVQLPVDHVYVVHYRKNVERRKAIEEALARLNVTNYDIRDDWDRERVVSERKEVAALFYAGAGSLELGSVANEKVLHRRQPVWKTYEGVRPALVDDVFLGRAANAMQHLKIYQEMLKRGQKSALVLEDDIAFRPEFVGALQAFFNEVPNDYDLVFVGGCRAKHAPNPNSERVAEHVYKVSEHRCASCYVISERGARAVLEAGPAAEFMNIDPFLERLMGSHLANTFWFEPPLAHEGTKALIPKYWSMRNAPSWLRAFTGS
jgi:hypothetical protein